jgi:hypothetical protein
MNTRTLLFAVGMLLGLWACQPQPSHLDENVRDSTVVGDSGAGATQRHPRDPGKHTTTPSADTSVAGSAVMLKSLRGMRLAEAMEIDDFRNRLEHDWGDVHSILLSSEAEFAQEGNPYLVAKGEIKQGGFTWAAILIVDLHQDAVFAAQYDGENKVFNQFEEEKEGLSQPAPLTAWTAKYR